MRAANFFRQRPNFYVDLAEIIWHELATLKKGYFIFLDTVHLTVHTMGVL
jgi:hypothetical protein